MSDIGETYGAASAVLSAFALVAIGVSLFLQAREMRFSRLEAERTHHFELMQLMIENPALNRALGMPRTGLDPGVHVYLNLVLSYWEMLFIAGEMTEPALMELACVEFFGTEAGTRFWEGTRVHRRRVAKSPRSEQFVEAIDRAWRQSLTLRPAGSRDGGVPAFRSPRPAALGAAAAATVAGVGIAWLILGEKRRDRG